MNQHFEFKVVLLHDNPVSGRRGTSVLERLAEQWEQEFEGMGVAVWKFEALIEPEFRNLAIAQIKEANMIIVSADGHVDLPDHLQNWLAAALSRRQQCDAALVALLDFSPQAGDKLPCLGGHLRSMAAQLSMEFFCNHGADPASNERARPSSAFFESESNFTTNPERNAWGGGTRSWENHGQN